MKKYLIIAILYLVSFILIFNCADKLERSPKIHKPHRHTEALARAIAAAKDRKWDKAHPTGQKALVHQPFKNPPELTAAGQKLDTAITVSFATNTLYNTVKEENIQLLHRAYNGQLTGPTLRVAPGDSLLLEMRNKLPQVVADPAGCDPYQQIPVPGDPNYIDSLRFNFTNLHTHGLHVSPMGHSDNVFVTLAPGCNFQNRIGVPLGHAQGTFWYHAHLHGSTAIQVSSGMGGALIITGGLDTLPEIEAMDEKIFVLQQIPYLPDTLGNNNNDSLYVVNYIEGVTFGPNTWGDGIEKGTGWRTTINGQTIPVIRMETQEVQRWRFIHAGVRETINLKLVRPTQEGFESCPMYAIAEDGIAYGYRQTVDSMALQPGYRADLLVQSQLRQSGQPDTLYLIDAASVELEGDEHESEKLMAIVILTPQSGQPVATTLPTDAQLRPYAPYPSLVNQPATDTMQYVQFEIDTSGDTTRFQINGVPFSHTNPPRTLQLNKIQGWTLTSTLGNHPYHIHVNHFQLMEKWVEENGRWVSQAIKPVWKDTYFVRSTDSIIVKTVYKDFIGDFVLHCHILDHEDQGMMQCVRIDSNQVINNYLLDQGINFCGPGYNNAIAKK